ncbi:MAG TPA: thrombospondin type 3 repeat-containing protein, partial [Polyangiaceae bacterium]|nr:thrombospondin type 3 repeat-containing protein [Polyangiaceae bacterium]
LGSLGWSSLARAKSEFPSEIKNSYGLTYDVPCSVCHIKGNVGSATPITPFALSLRARGLTGNNQSLSSALSKLESDGVDSDGDGVSDVEELKAGTDPNSSANASIVNDQDPGYGCGGTAPRGRSAPGMAGVLALGWLALRRRRAHS